MVQKPSWGVNLRPRRGKVLQCERGIHVISPGAGSLPPLSPAPGFLSFHGEKFEGGRVLSHVKIYGKVAERLKAADC
jgi:hypothetical protein